MLLLLSLFAALHLSVCLSITVPDCSDSTVIQCNSTTAPINEVLKKNNHSVCFNLSSGEFIVARENTTNGGLNLVFNQVILTGQGSGVTHVVCQKDAGLGFTGKNITLRNVTFVGCATLRYSTSHIEEITGNTTFQFWSALYFEAVENLYLLDVTVQDNPAVGITMYNVIGNHVLVQDCLFSGNSINPLNDTIEYPGGGGLYVEFTYCEQIDNTNENCTPSSNTFANYLISHTRFENNTATMVNKSETTFIVPNKIDHVAFSRGGGLSIFLKGNASSITISIESCNFSNNTALWGGGLLCEFHDTTHNNSILISNSILENNKCEEEDVTIGTAGGGARLAYLITDRNTIYNNLIAIQDCNFTSNKCMDGAGVSFSSTREINNYKATNKMNFKRCKWEGNNGLFGSGVNLHLWQESDIGVLPVVEFENAFFNSNNINISGTYPSQQGIAALYVDHIPVIFSGNVAFQLNKQTALAAITTAITVNESANISFKGNEADFGGAIFLSGYAYLKILAGAHILFKSNLAKLKGGAIYAEYIGRAKAILYASCFIRPEHYYTNPKDWDFTITFVNNHADYYGNDIYSTSLLPCIYPYVNIGKTQNISEAAHQVFNWSEVFSFSSKENSIATDGIIYANKSNMIKAYPGQIVNIPVTSRDELDHLSDVALSAHIQNPDYQLQLVQWITHTDGAIQFKSKTTNTSTKTYSNIEFSSMASTFKSQLSLEAVSCLDGYVLRNFTCVCGNVPQSGEDPIDILEGLGSCSDTALTIEKYYWVGHCNTTTKMNFSIGPCPDGYCDTNKTYLPIIEGSVESNCIPGRSGVLCSQCEDGYMPQLVSMGQIECTHCIISDHTSQSIFGSLMYFVLENGVLLLFCNFILFFGLSITHGPTHSLVFFSSILPTVLMYETDYEALKYSPFGPIYDVWQFRFFAILKSFVCMLFYTSPLTVVSLEFNKILVVIVFMIVAFGIISQSECPCYCLKNAWAKCRNKVRRLNKNYASNGRLVDGFAALIILCFAKMVEVSFKLLSNTLIRVSDGNSTINCTISRVGGTNSQCNACCTDDNHMVYIVLAILLVIFSGVLPFLLLYHSLIPIVVKKCPRLRICYFSCKRPFLDAFYKGYKLNCHFFSALYLLYRMVAWILFAFWPSVQRTAHLQFFLSIILGLHCMIHPFKDATHNKIETLNLLNLVLINALRSILLSSDKQKSNKEYEMLVLLVLYISLILLPAFLLICYFTLKFLQKVYIKVKAIRRRYNQNMDDHMQAAENEALREENEDDDVPWRMYH